MRIFKRIKRFIDKAFHKNRYNPLWFDAAKPFHAYQKGYWAALFRQPRASVAKHGNWALEGYDEYLMEHPIMIIKIHYI